ncbi:hypothetical protein [Acidithiobacillus ferriphilus]|uniref:hypothetical protein n=1 Tax=Acidithiobacillus ferriphilus TaxID=1689834 RepID=UPI002DBB6AD7|nr:hypothetical protein [Acidithiobacillus ferriphilus]MEB8474688.1 hypothetical protein [Acidithiobacillus ferriphilus]
MRSKSAVFSAVVMAFCVTTASAGTVAIHAHAIGSTPLPPSAPPVAGVAMPSPVSASVSAVDPFTGHGMDYEADVGELNTSNIVKKIKKNELDIAKIDREMSAVKSAGPAGATGVAGAQPVTAVAQQLAQQVSELQQQVSSMRRQLMLAERDVAKKRAENAAPRLVAIVGDSGDRSALIRVGSHVHAFKSFSTYKSFRVGKVSPSGVMVYGPEGGRFVKLSEVGAIGVMDDAEKMHQSSNGSGDTSGPSAINRHLLMESGVHVLPPRPGTAVPVSTGSMGFPQG